jgi:Chromo (CHRromatin Organisation MOdifier) domain
VDTDLLDHDINIWFETGFRPIENGHKRTIWFLVKLKGFPHGDNTWEKQKDISPELVEEFEATYQGNHLGVRLLEKRVRRGRVEYLVEWKGCPWSENSWEKEVTISRERIMEFEAN